MQTFNKETDLIQAILQEDQIVITISKDNFENNMNWVTETLKGSMPDYKRSNRWNNVKSVTINLID